MQFNRTEGRKLRKLMNSRRLIRICAEKSFAKVHRGDFSSSKLCISLPEVIFKSPSVRKLSE
jgi:hypothetical protein